MEEVAPPVIRVLNQDGEPIFDQLVTWVVTSGGGTVNPESSTTDRNGLASTKWRLGPAVGLNTVAAMVPGAETVTFTATAEVTGPTPSPSPDLSTVTAGPATIAVGTGVSTITVTVRDQSGARLPGATVLLDASGSGITLTQPAAPTNVDGVTTGSLRSTTPGTKTITAIVNGSVQIRQQVQVTVAGAVTHLGFLRQPQDVREGEPFTIQVALMDAGGNVVPLSGIEIYVDLFRAGKEHPDNTRALGDRFRDTVDGVAEFELRVVNGGSGGPTGHSEDGYRIRALTDELPEFGRGGPRPFLFSQPFDVD